MITIQALVNKSLGKIACYDIYKGFEMAIIMIQMQVKSGFLNNKTDSWTLFWHLSDKWCVQTKIKDMLD